MAKESATNDVQKEKLTLGITGMTCAACSSRIEKVLNKMDGVEAQVNLTTEKARIAYNPEMSTEHEIEQKIEKLGYGVQTETSVFDIQGMTCAACSTRIEKVLNKQAAIKEANVNLTNETANVTYLPGLISEHEIIKRIKKLGYDANVQAGREEKSSRKEKEVKRMQIKLIISTILSIPLLMTMLDHLFGIELPSIFMNPWFQLTFAAPVQFIIGWQFYTGAYKNVRNGSLNMDVLVSLGTSAAFLYSLYEAFKTIENTAYEPHLYFETSAILITLILFGKYLETRAKSQTTQAISKLLNLQAKEARIIVDGEEQMISVDDVAVGDTLRIKPGEKIPVDGEIIKGTTAIDESMITGESIPIEKNIGSKVIGATMNQNGSIDIEAEKVGKDTALASIVQAVEDAQGSKAPIQRLADNISGIFVPIVVGIAVVTFIIWMTLVDPGSVEPALVASIAVLVIACPCALGLATPTSIMVGTGKAADDGILFKGGEYLEQTHELDKIVFDKTGTITKGTPEVTDFTGDKEMLSLLASAEKGSEHPLATAIVSYATEQGLSLQELDAFEAIPGHGIKAIIHGQTVLAGNRKLLDDYQVATGDAEVEMTRLEKEGKTVMMLAVDGAFRGVIAVADTIKDTAQEAISQLKEQGLEIIMLTGDHATTAEAIATEAGIDTVIAGVLPEEKASHIKALQQDGSKVAMVGDGINDAPALAEATIGIAIGTGTEVAIEAADVTILRGELLLIPKAIQLSHATIKNIRQNLFWAFAYNSAGIPIAALGLLAPWIAGAAMAFSSVSVVLNALRLKRVKV